MNNTFLFVLVDRQHGHFYEFDGASRKLTHLAELTEEVPKPVKSASWKGLADDKVARHIEDHIREHLKHVAEKLTQFLKTQADTLVIIGGPEEVVAQFQTVLTPAVSDKIVASLHPDHYASLNELESLLVEAVARYRQAALHEIVSEIENDRQLSGRGIVGREAVCEALNLKQVQMLLIHPGSAYPGAYCPVDGTIAVLSTICSTCLKLMKDSPDLSQYLRNLALEQGAEIVEVADASLFPKDAEALAALKRF
jgi:peptide chain release factor subunit 1